VTALFDTQTARGQALQLADFATELISVHDAAGRFLNASAVSRELLGVDADELYGRRLLDLVHPEDVQAMETVFAGVPGEPRSGTVSASCRLRHADGYWAWVEITARPLPGAFDGTTVVSIRSAAELVAARQAAEWADQTLRQVFDHAPTPMAMLGLDNRIERVNPAFCGLLETTPDQLVGRGLAGFVEGGDSPADRFAMTELASGRTDQLTGSQAFLRAGGGSVTASTRRTVTHASTGRQQVLLHVLAVREATAAVSAMPPTGVVPPASRPLPVQGRGGAVDSPVGREAARPAPEGVTGLTSRPLLLDRLHLAVARPERASQFLVMFFVDLEGTSKVLGRHGRRSLEGVLVAAGNRLRSAVRGDDTVARFGDSGFVVLCPAVSASSDVVSLRKRLAHAVGDGPILVDGRKFKLTAQVGAAIVGPGEACDAEGLLERADSAMARHQ
jgi:diguanylate cyclase (GGDEF)-like protein/PAS domain S-box-containing protein